MQQANNISKINYFTNILNYDTMLHVKIERRESKLLIHQESTQKGKESIVFGYHKVHLHKRNNSSNAIKGNKNRGIIN